ncbi:hypothetical protein BVC80_1543g78 [Macleaya cordata]|uniref:Uncharacterized protein n=1 Tax=Macleaya cordata TaxID=56857 RepID=A0A200R1P3_MACCD|nr:hypothetical protein BVC80_1543g78 [Macleaya cordata]
MAAMEEDEDPFASICDHCIISSSQENLLLSEPLFAFELPPPPPVEPISPASSGHKSTGIAVSSVEDEEKEVSSQECTKIMRAEVGVQDERERAQPNVSNEKPPIENEVLQSPSPQRDVLVSPREEEPAPSTSNQRVRKLGEGISNSSPEITDILDIVRRRGIKVPRPRWWRLEGYSKKVLDPKRKGAEKKD